MNDVINELLQLSTKNLVLPYVAIDVEVHDRLLTDKFITVDIVFVVILINEELFVKP